MDAALGVPKKGRYSRSVVFEPRVLKAVCQLWRCVSMKPGVRMSFVVSTRVRLEGRVVLGKPEVMDVMVPVSSMRMEPLRITRRLLLGSSQAITVPPKRRVAALARGEPKVRLKSTGRCILDAR